MDHDDYSPPVAHLLTLGQPQLGVSKWPDYLAGGLTREHAPELARLVRDPRYLEVEGDALWGSAHAWRALGQLRATETIPDLIAYLVATPDDEWAEQEVPMVVAMMGEDALEPVLAELREAIASGSQVGAWPATLAGIAAENPDLRTRVVNALAGHLAACDDQDSVTNGLLIWALTSLRATEHLPLMQGVVEAGAADLGLGDWEDIEIELGLRETRGTLRSFPRLADLDFADEDDDDLDDFDEFPDPFATVGDRATPSTHAPARKEQRRKDAKKSKKANRKKKKKR